MATQTKQTETRQTDAKDDGRKFRVIKGQFGPWRASTPGSVNPIDTFNERQFRAMHPTTRRDKEGNAIEGTIAIGIYPPTYHDMLLERGILSGAIIEDPNAEVATDHLGIGENVDNAGILASMAEIRRQKADRIADLSPDAKPLQSSESVPKRTGGVFAMPAAAGV